MKQKLLLRKKLNSLDNSVKDFAKSLTPGNYHFLGIRIPLLKNLAKEINDKQAILDDPYDYYQEEILIYIYILSNTKLSKEDYLKYLDKWVKFKNHSWYTTDSGIKSCKFIKKDLDFYFSYFTNLLTSTDPFIVRIGIVAYFSFYKDPKYISKVLDNLLKVKLDNYYVNMALAWAYQDIYSFYDANLMLEWIKKTKLNSRVVLELTKRKILESKKTTNDEKLVIKTL